MKSSSIPLQQQRVVSPPAARVAAINGMGWRVLLLTAALFATGGAGTTTGFKIYPKSSAFILRPPIAPSPVRRAVNLKATLAQPRCVRGALNASAAQMSLDPPQSSMEASKDGDLALALAGPAAPVAASSITTTAAVSVEGNAQDVASGGDAAAMARDRDEAAAEVVERAINALPGTWWAAGLPKWMHLVRRRMITKEDFLHLHAVSGMVSQRKFECFCSFLLFSSFKTFPVNDHQSHDLLRLHLQLMPRLP